MQYKGMTTLGLAALLMTACATQSFGQSAVRSRTPFEPPTGRVGQAETAAPADKGAAADTTLRYYQAREIASFTGILGGDFRAAGTFFRAPFDGKVDRVDFALFGDLYPNGTNGTGTLRVKMVPATEVIDPTSPGVDSLDLDFSQLMDSGTSISPGNLANKIDLTGRNFEMVKGQEYFMQLSLVDDSPDAEVSVVFDGGSTDTTDTRYYPARTFLYILAASAPDTLDWYYSFVNHRNLIMEMQLTKAPLPPPAGTARVQFIHDALDVGLIDLYVGGERVVDDLAFQGATPFIEVPAGAQTLDVVAGNAVDNSNPLYTTATTITRGQSFYAVALGRLEQNFDVLLRNVYPEGGEKRTSLLLVHGGEVGGDAAVDIRRLSDRAGHALLQMLAEDLAFGQTAGPIAVPDSLLNIEVASAAADTSIDVYRLDMRPTGVISADIPTRVLLTSGVLGGTPPFTLFLVKEDGTVAVAGGSCEAGMPSSLCVSTATEAGATPGTFALYANYPNPFNPATTIRFDLGAPAYTTLKVYNLLGQEVATLVAERLPAQSYQVVFDAAGLPSGPYLYRLTAGAFSEQRLLMLVK